MGEVCLQKGFVAGSHFENRDQRKMGTDCILTTLHRITFLLEERYEQLSHGPIQDLTGRPRHHVMADTPDP